MEALSVEFEEASRRKAGYEAALDHRKTLSTHKVARGHALMSMIMGYGSAVSDNTVFAHLSHAALLFCIAFACAVPVLPIWNVAF
ncbi:MAG: hypothetical protein GDA40_07695 [Rhodobacteraceae bacterium]|nr:hypothetical protein [Paracoccaceae bacterium]